MYIDFLECYSRQLEVVYDAVFVVVHFFPLDMTSSRIKLFPKNSMPLILSNSLQTWSGDNTNAIPFSPVFWFIDILMLQFSFKYLAK